MYAAPSDCPTCGESVHHFSLSARYGLPCVACLDEQGLTVTAFSYYLRVEHSDGRRWTFRRRGGSFERMVPEEHRQ